jgi:ubiquinone/menaquinone biosynthesis C-methylase UbiE
MRPSSPDPAVEREFRAWLHSAHSPAFSRRTASRNAAFLLPELRSGMRVLDAGCGPGSITIGLAQTVAPGEVVGIDANPTALEAARAAAAAAGVTNLRFEVGDLHRMPFADESFDAVFAHAVLQHVPDPERAVQALARVVKPGGVIGLADADWDGFLIWPTPRAMRRALRLMRDLRKLSGGDFRVGKKLGRLLAQSGCVDVRSSVVTGTEGDATTTRYNGEHWARYYGSEALRRMLPALGIATEAEIEEASAAWRAWGETPGALAARNWCQAVGRKAG